MLRARLVAPKKIRSNTREALLEKTLHSIKEDQIEQWLATQSNTKRTRVSKSIMMRVIIKMFSQRKAPNHKT